MGKTTKMWKSYGEEDKFIENLILKGKINKHSTPSGLRKDYPHIFEDFSTSVIRNHLNELRKRYGVYGNG